MSTESTEPQQLETITLTPAELDERIREAEERGKNRAWADARKHFALKATKAEQIAKLEERVGQLEQVVATALEQLFPGFSGAPSTKPAEKEIKS